MPVFGYVSLRDVGRVPINTPVIIKADINVSCHRHQRSHHRFPIITSMSAVNAITAIMPAVTTVFPHHFKRRAQQLLQILSLSFDFLAVGRYAILDHK